MYAITLKCIKIKMGRSMDRGMDKCMYDKAKW